MPCNNDFKINQDKVIYCLKRRVKVNNVFDYVTFDDTFWDICGNPASGGSVLNPDISYSNPPYISTQNIVDPKFVLRSGLCFYDAFPLAPTGGPYRWLYRICI